MSSAGKKVGTVLGATLGVGFSAAVEAGTKFEDQLAIINTVAQVTPDVLNEIGDGIQALSRETGKSTDDLTAGYYDLVSAGVPAADAINVLRDSAKFATGALGTTGEAVDLVTSALNAYGLGADQSTRVTDIFAKAVADGKVTAAELGASLAQVAPIASAAGVSLEEVSAGYAQLTAKGVPAASAAIQMKSAITSLINPNEALNKIQQETGVNFAELMKAKGLAVALDTLRGSVGGNEAAFTKALGSTESYQFALATTGENAEAFAAQIIETGDAAGLAQTQYDIAASSAKNAGDKMAAWFNTMLQDIGGPFVQSMGPVLQMTNNLGPAFSGALSGAKVLTGAIGGLAGRLFGGLVAKLMPEAIIAGAALGEAQGQAQGTAAASPKVASIFRSAFGRQAAMLVPAAAAAGTTVGVAQGEAQAAAASSPGIISRMVGAITGALKTLAVAVVGPSSLVGRAIAVGIEAGQKAAGFVNLLVRYALMALATVAIAVAGPSTIIGSAITTAIGIGMALAPFILVAALVGLLIAIVKDPTLIQKAIDIGVGVIRFLGEGIGKMAGWLVGAIGGVVGGALDGIAALVGTVLSGLIEPIRAVVDIINKVTNGSLNDLLAEIDSFQDKLERKTAETTTQVAGDYEDMGLRMVRSAQGTAQGMGRALEKSLDPAIAAGQRYVAARERLAADVTASDTAMLGSARRTMNGIADAQYDGAVAAAQRYTTATRAAADQVESAARSTYFQTVQRQIDAVVDAVREAGRKAPGAMAQEVRDRTDSVNQAWKDLRDAVENTISPIKETARLETRLASKFMADALRDGRPAVRLQAQQTAIESINRLAELKPGSAEIGRATQRLLAAAIGDEKYVVIRELRGVAADATAELAKLRGIASSAGSKISPAMASAIGGNSYLVRNALMGLTNLAARALRLESPAKEGPWSEGGGPIAWMESAGRRIAEGLAGTVRAGIPGARSAFAELAAVAEAGAQRAAKALAGARASAAAAQALVGGRASGANGRGRNDRQDMRDFRGAIDYDKSWTRRTGGDLPTTLAGWRQYLGGRGDDGRPGISIEAGSDYYNEWLAWQRKLIAATGATTQEIADYLRTGSPSKKGAFSKGGGPGGWMATMGADMVANLRGQIGGMQHASALVAEALTPQLTAPDIGAMVGRSGTLNAGSGSMTVRHEFGPITVNGNVSPEAGREIGRGIGEGIGGADGYLRNHRREMLMPVEPGF